MYEKPLSCSLSFQTSLGGSRIFGALPVRIQEKNIVFIVVHGFQDEREIAFWSFSDANFEDELKSDDTKIGNHFAGVYTAALELVNLMS